MGHRIELLPSGHVFQAEAEETLLEAALRSGLNLRYNCNSGSCGDCQARLVSGELGHSEHQDYVFSREEKANHHFLMCRAHAAGDLVIEAVEARTGEDIPHHRITTTVARLNPLSETVMELQLRTPRTQTLWFLAGQYVTLSGEGLPARNKSIASCPCNGMVLQFHVQYVEGDPFAEYVFKQMKPREKVEVEGPYGRFTLDEASGRPCLFLACETGFAPVKSLVEHAISLEFNQPLRLYWAAPRAEDLYLANYCRSWQDALDDFRFVPVVGEGDNPDWTPPEIPDLTDVPSLSPRARRLLHAGLRITGDYPDLSGYDVYVNGPDADLVALIELLVRHGLPPERLFVDRIVHVD